MLRTGSPLIVEQVYERLLMMFVPADFSSLKKLDLNKVNCVRDREFGLNQLLVKRTCCNVGIPYLVCYVQNIKNTPVL